MDTHHKILQFGKHKGELWTRVPVSYLSWLANQESDDEPVQMAREELERRGSNYPDIEVSGHAIDRASTQCHHLWKGTKNKGEGIHSWLTRMAGEAREHGQFDGSKYRYKGMKFAFEEGRYYPALKTVMSK